MDAPIPTPHDLLMQEYDRVSAMLQEEIDKSNPIVLWFAERLCKNPEINKSRIDRAIRAGMKLYENLQNLYQSP